MSDKQQASVGLAPHSIEAEEAVLGSVLLDADALHDVKAVVEPGDFFLVRYQWIYEAILAVSGRGEPVDYITVLDELTERKRLDEIGGPAQLIRLTNSVGTSWYADTYAQIVRRASIRRLLITAGGKIATLAHSEDADIDTVLDTAQAELAAVTAKRQIKKADDAASIASRTFDGVQTAYDAGGSTGLLTGLSEFDGLTGGLQPGDVLIVAGRPGMGKTALLLTILMNATQKNKRVGLFSLEMNDEQNTQRLIAMMSGVSVNAQRSGKMTPEEFCKFTAATGDVSAWPFYIDDQGGLTLSQLQAKVRRWHNEHGLDLVMLDYIGLMNAARANDNDTRARELGMLSNGIKQFARALGVPFIVASQLNRAVEQRQDKRPVLSDLRESGDLEQDADMVAFLYRDEVYNANSERAGQADLILAKNRNGETGTAALYFDKARMRFANLRRADLDLRAYGGSA